MPNLAGPRLLIEFAVEEEVERVEGCAFLIQDVTGYVPVMVAQGELSDDWWRAQL